MRRQKLKEYYEMQTGLITFEVISKINGVDVDLRSIAREYGIGEGFNTQRTTFSPLTRISKTRSAF